MLAWNFECSKHVWFGSREVKEKMFYRNICIYSLREKLKTENFFTERQWDQQSEDQEQQENLWLFKQYIVVVIVTLWLMKVFAHVLWFCFNIISFLCKQTSALLWRSNTFIFLYKSSHQFLKKRATNG